MRWEHALWNGRVITPASREAMHTAMLAHYPDDDLVVAVLVNTNGDGVPDARSIEAQIGARLAGPSRPLRHHGDGVFADRRDLAASFASSLQARAEWVVHTMHDVDDNVLRRTSAGK